MVHIVGQKQTAPWKDLADAFLKQYKFNCDVAPTRRDLQNLVQRDRESFKEYAQRWREKAAEVYPLVTDNELCSLFIETLKAPFFQSDDWKYLQQLLRHHPSG